MRFRTKGMVAGSPVEIVISVSPVPSLIEKAKKMIAEVEQGFDREGEQRK